MHPTLVAGFLWLYWAFRLVIWYVTALLEINPIAAAKAATAVTAAKAAATAAGSSRIRIKQRRVLDARIVRIDGVMDPVDVTDHLNCVMMGGPPGQCVNVYIAQAMKAKQRPALHPSELVLKIMTMDLEEFSFEGDQEISSSLWIDDAAAMIDSCAVTEILA